MRYKFTGEVTAQTSFTLLDVGFNAKNLTLVSSPENSAKIQWSFDGTTVDGQLSPGEPINKGNLLFRRIWVKALDSGQKYRLWAWAK